MLAMEAEVKAMGLDRISLHVFGHNPGARRLYEKLGYETTNVYMAKQLGMSFDPPASDAVDEAPPNRILKDGCGCV
jgi:hypothetical protein